MHTSNYIKKLHRDYIFVFLILWFTTGLSINLNDQRAFNLQQMGIDAIVSHGTFTLGHSKLEIMTPIGDTFHTPKGILPAKQPGQFVTGAIPYLILKNIGLTYEKNYNLTASLVTWLSTSLLSAISLTLLFQLLKIWGYQYKHAMWSVFSVGLCSHWLVYAGIAHHDIVASSYLLIALYLSEFNLIKRKGNGILSPIFSGIFAGLTIFSSMLPALIVMVFGFYILASLNRRHIIWVGIGFTIGLLPLAIYNNYYFDSLFKQANIAGNYADTFFNFNLNQFTHHVNAYIGWGGLSIWKYSPIIMLGFFGLFFLPKQRLAVKAFIFGACFIHLAYITNIETLGTCQYAPRYLVPLLPLCIIGLTQLLHKFEKTWQFEWGLIFGILVTLSFAASIVGALGGAMQCDLNNFMMIKYLNHHNKWNTENWPLFFPMFWSILCVLAYSISIKTNKYLKMQRDLITHKS